MSALILAQHDIQENACSSLQYGALFDGDCDSSLVTPGCYV
jgi:hypothetical protein